MNNLTPASLYLVTAIALIVIGFAGALIRRNLLKIVLGFSLVDTGLHLLIGEALFKKFGKAFRFISE